MGMHVAVNGGGKRRRRGSAHQRPMAEINMTPFIDVMLVLMIIFMVAAPMLVSDVPFELPASSGAPQTTADPKEIVIRLGEDGEEKNCYQSSTKVNGETIPDQLIISHIQGLMKSPSDIVTVEASKNICYDTYARMADKLFQNKIPLRIRLKKKD